MARNQPFLRLSGALCVAALTACGSGGGGSSGGAAPVAPVVVNLAPSFDVVANQSTDEDQALSLTVTNLSPNDATQLITSLTATSSNAALVSNGVVSIAGTSATITFAPVADQFGSATITLTATDDGGVLNGGVDSFSQTFTLDVVSVNDPPSFDNIANQSAAQNAAAQTVTITGVSAGPANESAAQLTLTASSSNTQIVTNPTVVISGTTATLSYTPTTGQTGTVTITVVADDGGAVNNQFSQSFEISIIGVIGNASILSATPSVASSDGGTLITVVTSNYPDDFTVTTPSARIGAVILTPTVVNATTVTLTVPAGLAVGATTIGVRDSTQSVSFPNFEIVAPVAVAELLINEVLANPGNTGSTALDVNGDGAASGSEDEFVEIVNVRATAVDLTGLQVSDGAAVRHVFPNPTTLPAGAAIAVFGGGTPTGFAALHDNGSAQAATSGSLGLTNGGDSVTLTAPAPSTTIIAQETLGQATALISANRLIDADVTAAFVDHSAVTGANGDFSPALRVDGTLHQGAASNAQVDSVVPALGSSDGGTIVTVSTNGFQDDFTVTAPTATIAGATATVVVIDATTLTVSVPSGLTVSATTLVLTTANDNASASFEIVAPVGIGELIVNEVFADPGGGAAGTIDANGDGNTSTTEDEFVEIVNLRTGPIDLTNFELNDGFGQRHVFPNPTTLPTGAAIVIFGGGAPTGFALAQQNGQAQVASSGSLGLNNGGDTVSVGQPSPSTTLLTSTTFGASTDQVSLNRAIDADINSSFVDHNLAETAAGLADAVGDLSPGLRVNGTAHQGGAQGGGGTGNAVVSAIKPGFASSAGGTQISIATTGFAADFTSTQPSATVDGLVATVSATPSATNLVILVPPGVSVGAVDIVVTAAGDTATFSGLQTLAPATAGELVINEFLSDPVGTVIGAGDTNNDGTVDGTQDEFVELVNTRTTSVDLTGFELSDAVTTRHVFPNPTIVPAGGAIVVFGGGSPTGFAGIGQNGAAQTASSNALALTNSGDTVTLTDAGAATVIDTVSFGGTTDSVSRNRATDGDITAAFVDHDTVTGATTDFSPGNKVDGTLFGPAAAIANLSPTAASSAGGTFVTVDTTGFTTAFTVTAPTATVGAAVAAVQVIDADSVTLRVPTGLSAGTQALVITQGASSATFQLFSIVSPATVDEVVVNEVFADPGPTGSIVDANGDGVPSTTGDEFVELVNTRSTPVDLSGFQIFDAASGGTIARHTFPNPTVLPAGGSIVVFGGGTPTGFAAAGLSGAAQTASSNSLGLNNGGDDVTLKDASGATVNAVIAYPSATDGVSFNRATDGDPAAAVQLHNTVSGASGDLSPGVKVDGTSF